MDPVEADSGPCRLQICNALSSLVSRVAGFESCLARVTRAWSAADRWATEHVGRLYERLIWHRSFESQRWVSELADLLLIEFINRLRGWLGARAQQA